MKMENGKQLVIIISIYPLIKMDNDEEWARKNKIILEACHKEIAEKLRRSIEAEESEKIIISFPFVPNHSLPRVLRILKKELSGYGFKVSEYLRCSLVISD